MGRWLNMLENEICTDSEPTKPPKREKRTLVGLVGSKSKAFQKNKSGRWLSQIKPKNTLVGLVDNEFKQIEKISLPKVWNLKIKSSDGIAINSMTMIDPARMCSQECKEHLVRQFGENRVVEYGERSK